MTMTKIEIFENLLEPIKSSVPQSTWDFIMSRGEIFIAQTTENQISNPITQLNYKLVNRLVKLMKENEGKTVKELREIPEFNNIHIAMEVIKPYVEEEK
jgi:hypothetical protein